MYQEVPASGNRVLLPLLLLLVVWCVCCLPLGGERTHLGRLGPMDKCMDEIKKGGVGTLMLKGASHSATATAISSTVFAKRFVTTEYFSWSYLLSSPT